MTASFAEPVLVLIASPLEVEHVDRIAAAELERVRVLYEPELLPVPRYGNDHHGIHRALDVRQRRRWRDLLAQAEVMFDFDWEDPQHLLQRAPRVKWIQATSAGIGEYVRSLGLPKCSVKLTTAAGVHAQALAEFVVLSMLYFARDVPHLCARQAEHHWERYCGRELAGSTALLLGLGQVGRRVAELVAALDVHVLGLRRSPGGDQPAGVLRLISAEQLDATLPEVDYLIVATPYTSETHHLVDEHQLSLLPSSAVVINIGRGQVVDESALIAALEAGRLGGAALDVFEREPLPPDNPLWDMPNVLISPHSASTVEGENGRIVDIFIENLHRYLDHQPLINQFDYDLGY